MATVDDWLAPGSGNNLAPNSCWLRTTAASVNWQARFDCYTAAGVLKVISGCSFGIWDVTSNTQVSAITVNNVTGGNISATMPTNGHIYALFLNYQAGTLPDHAIIKSTSIGAGAIEHAIAKVRRSGAWVSASGHVIRIRRGGVWVPLPQQAPCNNFFHNGGLYVRRTGVWTSA